MICSNKPSQKTGRKSIYNPMADPACCSRPSSDREEAPWNLFWLYNESFLLETLRYCSSLFSALQPPDKAITAFSPGFMCELKQELRRHETAVRILLEHLEAADPGSRSFPLS